MLKDSELTPMYRQWAQAKRDHPDVLILFRMGDFYEMFGEDAEVASRVLGLTLTSRRMGDTRMPMCGVPHHAIDRYLRVLIATGMRAAICEQVEDPKKTKGLVRREVTRIVTPGTLMEDELMQGSAHNFLVSVDMVGDAYGVAAVDVSTGDFIVTQIDQRIRKGSQSIPLPETVPSGIDPTVMAMIDELVRLQPAEVVLSERVATDTRTNEIIANYVEAPIHRIPDEPSFTTPAIQLREHFGVSTLLGFGCDDKPAAIAAAAQALKYLKTTQMEAMPRLTGITTYSTDDFMVIDASTRRNLELVQSLRDGGRHGTLLELLDNTETPMGARMLKSAILQPLLSVDAIHARLDAVDNFVSNSILTDQLRQRLHAIYDLERLATRATAGRANGKDLRALCVSLRQLPDIRAELSNATAPLLTAFMDRIDPLEDVADMLDRAIVDEPPVLITEGRIIREGYSEALDELRDAAAHGREWITQLQEGERARTGIKSLKVGYNRVFGYYIEVSRANSDLVPDDYQRKQTLVNGERFITPELKEKEAKILGAEERSQEMEYSLFVEIRERAAAVSDQILATARAVAELDMLVSLALAAIENSYIKPDVDEEDALVIIDGRHPVVERTSAGELFVPNDAHLNCRDSRLLIVTGPNMAGKSTYLRQVALIGLMAQIGSFVPARSCRIGVLDRIFTRVGASDDLATGQSTFMVEMTEAANILQNATDRSLIVLDELGRGTSTYDGMSLAWAVAEYINEQIGAKTLFATHYHHLNELEGILEGVRNLRITVKEQGEDIIFLRKIVPGGTDRSYGIQVGRLAGLPAPVIERAREILHTLEQEDIAAGPSKQAAQKVAPTVQLQLFEGVRDPVVEELKRLDLDTMAPLEALMKLKALQDEAKCESS